MVPLLSPRLSTVIKGLIEVKLSSFIGNISNIFTLGSFYEIKYVWVEIGSIYNHKGEILSTMFMEIKVTFPQRFTCSGIEVFCWLY